MNIENKLRNLKKSEPKSFRKEISTKNAKDIQYGNVSLDDFAKHFEMLNLDESAHVVQINPHQSTDTGATGSSNITVNAVNDIVAQTMNNVLNRPFTSSEIMNTIKSLKNNKAVGIDSIRNEYIKSSSDKLVHIYEKLFNTILNLGVVPESWSIGIIKPLDKKQR